MTATANTNDRDWETLYAAPLERDILVDAVCYRHSSSSGLGWKLEILFEGQNEVYGRSAQWNRKRSFKTNIREGKCEADQKDQLVMLNLFQHLIFHRF